MGANPAEPHRQQQMRGLTFDHLFAIRTIASAGSFREASKILCLSQPAVSQRVQFIEHVLGAPIFERHSGIGVTLTAVGEVLLEFCDQAMADLDGLSQRVTRVSEAQQESMITITAPSDSIQHFLIRMLPLFRAKFPRRHVRVTQSGSREDTIAQIENGTADLAFYRMPMDLHLTPIAIMTERLHLVSAPSHEINSVRPDDRPASLGGYPFATYLPKMRTRQLIERWAVRNGAELRVDIESQSPAVMKQSAITGTTLSVLPGTAIAEDLEAGRLQVVQIDGMPLERSTALAVKPGIEVPAAVRELVDVLVKVSRAATDEGTPEIRWANDTRVQVGRALAKTAD